MIVVKESNLTLLWIDRFYENIRSMALHSQKPKLKLNPPHKRLKSWLQGWLGAVVVRGGSGDGRRRFTVRATLFVVVAWSVCEVVPRRRGSLWVSGGGLSRLKPAAQGSRLDVTESSKPSGAAVGHVAQDKAAPADAVSGARTGVHREQLTPMILKAALYAAPESGDADKRGRLAPGPGFGVGVRFSQKMRVKLFGFNLHKISDLQLRVGGDSQHTPPHLFHILEAKEHQLTARPFFAPLLMLAGLSHDLLIRDASGSTSTVPLEVSPQFFHDLSVTTRDPSGNLSTFSTHNGGLEASGDLTSQGNLVLGHQAAAAGGGIPSVFDSQGGNLSASGTVYANHLSVSGNISSTGSGDISTAGGLSTGLGIVSNGPIAYQGEDQNQVTLGGPQALLEAIGIAPQVQLISHLAGQPSRLTLGNQAEGYAFSLSYQTTQQTPGQATRQAKKEWQAEPALSFYAHPTAGGKSARGRGAAGRDGSSPLSLSSSGVLAPILTLGQSGQVTIGADGSGARLVVKGPITTDACFYQKAAGVGELGTQMGTCPSDGRIKKEIRPYDVGLEVLLGIKPRIFKFNGLTGEKDTESDQLGVIAQELQQVAPGLVSEHHQVRLHPEDPFVPLKSVNYGAFLFIAIRAIQQLYDKGVQDQAKVQAQVQALQSENQALKRSLEGMRRYLCASSNVAAPALPPRPEFCQSAE